MFFLSMRIKSIPLVATGATEAFSGKDEALAGPPGRWRTGQEPVLPGVRDIGWCLLKRKMK